jgi:2-polyprenyl-3-methyl-5-hydroxy-6-metoxy-1,4-benzoquinol methylase
MTTGSVADVLKVNQQLLPSSAKVLDIACGLGANALFLAARGLEVHAWDISAVASDKLNLTAQQQGLKLHTQCRDVVTQPPRPESFDLIVVCRFLERELCPAIAAALKPGGLLFYQTYTRDSNRAEGPRNPQFLLAQGELLELFSGLEVELYQEGDEAMFIGRRGAAGP